MIQYTQHGLCSLSSIISTMSFAFSTLQVSFLLYSSKAPPRSNRPVMSNFRLEHRNPEFKKWTFGNTTNKSPAVSRRERRGPMLSQSPSPRPSPQLYSPPPIKISSRQPPPPLSFPSSQNLPPLISPNPAQEAVSPLLDQPASVRHGRSRTASNLGGDSCEGRMCRDG